LHLEEVYVIESQLINTGQIIATSGLTGNAKINHLHFGLSSSQMIYKDSVNPSFFFVDGIDDKCMSTSDVSYEEYLGTFR